MEMLETATMLRHARRSSLLLLDELGRGTSTHDGYAIAYAVLHSIAHEIRARCAPRGYLLLCCIASDRGDRRHPGPWVMLIR